jgi:predicted HTH transcriptional regulator
MEAADKADKEIKSKNIAMPKKSEERAAKIKAFKAENPNMSNRMIASALECSEKTVRNALNS